MDKTETKTDAVTIPCPRCGGQGCRPEWHPDAGICYRCHGRSQVVVVISRHAGALRHLRAKYARVRARLAEATDADDQAQLREYLDLITADGIRVRSELEQAQAAAGRR
jgi:hypothetical protein